MLILASQKAVDEGDLRITDDPKMANPPEKTKGCHKAASAQILAGGYTRGSCRSQALNLVTNYRIFCSNI